MRRAVFVFFLLAASAFAATIKLYLTDGTYQLVREYEVKADRVRFYSTERSEWEEVPLSLVDLKRTRTEEAARREQVKKDAEELSQEEQFERAQRKQLERIPQETGVYLIAGDDLKTLKQAESKVSTNKSRSILKVIAPIPVVSGKAEVELDGERSATVVTTNHPEFYIRLASDERFGIVRLTHKKGVRVVQKWTIVPVTKQMVEEEDDVDVFRQQLDEGLYKIWPSKPLSPGEYAVIEYTEGKGNVQTWDFSCQPAASR